MFRLVVQSFGSYSLLVQEISTGTWLLASELKNTQLLIKCSILSNRSFGNLLLLSTSRNIELEEDDVSILHHVCLSFLPVLSSGLQSATNG
jgi:hypothetical protein